MTPCYLRGGSLFLVLLGLLTGCAKTPPSRPVEFPFEHPAAAECHRIFRNLKVYSEEDYRKLSPRDQYVWDVGCFEDEVMNGGVDQYFYNSAGDHAVECLEALKAIGADQSYNLLKQACDLFPEGKPIANREARQEQLRAIAGEKHLDDLIQGKLEVDLYQRLLDFYRRGN